MLDNNAIGQTKSKQGLSVCTIAFCKMSSVKFQRNTAIKVLQRQNRCVLCCALHRRNRQTESSRGGQGLALRKPRTTQTPTRISQKSKHYRHGSCRWRG